MRNKLRLAIFISIMVNAMVSLAQAPTYFYYVPFPEQQIHNSFLVLYSGTGSTYHTVVSIVPSESNIRIYYDQWEDGYEANLS